MTFPIRAMILQLLVQKLQVFIVLPKKIKISFALMGHVNNRPGKNTGKWPILFEIIKKKYGDNPSLENGDDP